MIIPPGHKAPDFTLENHLGKRIQLYDLKGPKAVYFFPTAFSFYCGNKIPGMDALVPDMKLMGVRHFLAISRESIYANRNFCEALALEHFSLYSDLDNRVAREWGTFIPRGSQRVNKRAFFILDENNVVRFNHDITLQPAEFDLSRILMDLSDILAGPPPEAGDWDGPVEDQGELGVFETPCVGERAPDFQVMDYKMNPVALSDYRGKRVVLVFHRYDFYPACNEFLFSLARAREEFTKRGAVVLAINRDNPYTHKAWAEEYDFVGGHLLSDMNSAVAQRWGLYVGGPERAHRKGVFIIDKDGWIVWKKVFPRLDAVIPASEVLEALDQLEE